MFKIEKLRVEVPGFALKDIDLHIAQGEFFAIMGPTGSGKSLLMETIMGLLPANVIDFKGSILWNNKELTRLPPNKRSVGILYQDVALFPHMTVKQNISYGLRYHRIDKEEAQKRFNFLIERLGIAHLLHRYPARISGGERQRVGLARVLVLNPDVILLDEPLSGLDPLLKKDIRRLLRQLHSELKITFLMVSHNFEEVMYLAQKGAIIRQGRIIQQGQIEEIFNRPTSLFAAQFVGAKNVFPAHCQDGFAHVGSIPVQIANTGKEASCDHIVIRPERIVPLASGTRAMVGMENVYSGTIVEMSRCNFHVNVSIERNGVVFQAMWPEHHIHSAGLNVGSKVRFGFSKDDVGAFNEEKRVVPPSDLSTDAL